MPAHSLLLVRLFPASRKTCTSCSLDLVSVSSVSSCDPRLTARWWDQGSVAVKLSVAGLCVLLVTENSSLWLWLYVWTHHRAAEFECSTIYHDLSLSLCLLRFTGFNSFSMISCLLSGFWCVVSVRWAGWPAGSQFTVNVYLATCWWWGQRAWASSPPWTQHCFTDCSEQTSSQSHTTRTTEALHQFSFLPHNVVKQCKLKYLFLTCNVYHYDRRQRLNSIFSCCLTVLLYGYLLINIHKYQFMDINLTCKNKCIKFIMLD